ncbi:hypothetical protein IQ268_12865 [Oculatella sp. LEGE 06141]|uniref:hypothetical protein n=1 Tax=Oculatella sp. LEGE 06141 TaxID=1828648 RepID=UPI0018826193|nr:hypothetical protein [Oculatella sp. LEGE 06141]MBE9179454.1 hypothetical protein [Oculatella sp. LEGE 06141]
MTSTILVPNRLSAPPNPQAVVYEPGSASDSAPLSNCTGDASSHSSARQLPYQQNHQAELLHLQAETEALLQQLQTLKQQRMAASHQSSNHE